LHDKVSTKFGIVCNGNIVLNRILNITNAEIILTSQWRNEYTRNEIEAIFEHNKIVKNPIDCTIDLGGFCRSKEIELFLEENPVNNYVILDDVFIEGFENNYVEINPDIGLTEDLISIILKKIKFLRN
jgi:hypothetical protein